MKKMVLLVLPLIVSSSGFAAGPLPSAAAQARLEKSEPPRVNAIVPPSEMKASFGRWGNVEVVIPEYPLNRGNVRLMRAPRPTEPVDTMIIYRELR